LSLENDEMLPKEDRNAYDCRNWPGKCLAAMHGAIERYGELT